MAIRRDPFLLYKT